MGMSLQIILGRERKGERGRERERRREREREGGGGRERKGCWWGGGRGV